MRELNRKIIRAVLFATGLSEAIIGLSIVLFAQVLQKYLAGTALEEPLYFRMIGMMDFCIGVCYIFIGISPEKYFLYNKGTSFMRLALSCLFFAEGFWLLHNPTLRLVYQVLAFFDLFLFIIQTVFLKTARRGPG